MGKIDIEILKKTVSEYSLTTNIQNELLERLKKSVIDNGNLITDANKEDVKISKKQVKIKKILEIIDFYKTKKFKDNKRKTKIVIYKGDPYLTLNICLQALISKTKVILLCDDFMIGVNKVLIKIILNVFGKYRIDNLINFNTNYTLEDIDKLEKICDDIVVIGDTLIYQQLKDNKKKIKFYSYNNIVLYCDSNELLKLQEAIYIYANENQFELEIVYLKSIDEVLERVKNNKLINTVVLLTKSNTHKELFESSLKDKDVYVNDNPFKQEVGRIYNYFE